MALYDLLLPWYRPQRVDDNSLFHPANGIYYDIKEEKLRPTEGYSIKEVVNVSRLKQLNGVLASFLYLSLAIAFGTGIFYQKPSNIEQIKPRKLEQVVEYVFPEGKKEKNSKRDLLLYVLCLSGAVRSVGKTRVWGAVKRDFKKGHYQRDEDGFWDYVPDNIE